MRIRYRNKIRLKKLLRVSVLTLLVCAIGLLAVFAYADSLIVYDENGAHLSAESATVETTQKAPRPAVVNPTIVMEQGQIEVATIAETGGYYITTSMLRNIDSVMEAVRGIAEPCAVMLELKSIWGYFYYATNIPGAPNADAEISKIEELISYLNTNGFYTIASIPAFPDPQFALQNQSCGLPLSSGALWMDDNGCYWLDPNNDNVVSYLMQIVRELSAKGVKEVAFSDFRFPESSSIVYSADPDTVIEEAAQELYSFFQGGGTAVSFVTTQTAFPLGDCTGRVYIPNVDGSQVERYVQAYGEQESLSEVVFLANSRDTRFEGQAVLRPLLTE